VCAAVVNATFDFGGHKGFYNERCCRWVNQETIGVDFLEGLLSFALMMGAVALIIALLAVLFMIIFSIATGVDEHLQE